MINWNELQRKRQNAVRLCVQCGVLTLCSLCLPEAASVPSRHLAGPDGDFQTQELALLQLQGHADHLPDVLRGHV